MSNNNAKRYGSFQDLSQSTEQKITEIISMFDEKEINYSIYYGYPVIDEKNQRDYVKGIIISSAGIIILHENSLEQDVYYSRVVQLISQDNELFSKVRRLNYIHEVNLNSPPDVLIAHDRSIGIFTEELVIKANRAIQTAYGLSKEDNREVTNSNSLGSKIKKRNTFIGSFDETQFNMIHAYDNENLRIRGLAGSGKTILLVKKMAYLHFKFPEKKIAFIFYTITLKQTIIELFKNYYKDYDRYSEPDMTKINIFHSWGGMQKKGFYSDFSLRTGNIPKTFSDATYLKEEKEDPYEFVCRDVLERIDVGENLNFYDYIFVDEAQDFKINFFKLVRKSLSENGKLIYAYDELQSLSEENSIPSKSEIFKQDECLDINLKTSYRAPVEILTTAHALGLGIYRDTNEDELPFVNMIRDKEVWLDIGYQVTNGNLQYGEFVELARNESRLDEPNIINTLSFENETEQYTELANIIVNLLKTEDVKPEDILIIDLSYKLAANHAEFRRIFNTIARQQNLLILGTEKLAASINLVNKDNPIRMKLENTIPYTTIYRAKGNEANLVFIVNSDSLEMVKSVSRNKIFTAMTRARYAVWLMGSKTIEVYEKEIEKARYKEYKLDFIYPTEKELDDIKTYGALEVINEVQIKNVADNIVALKNTDPALAKKILLDMLKSLGDEGE